METFNMKKFHPNEGYIYILPKINMVREDTDYLDTKIGVDILRVERIFRD